MFSLKNIFFIFLLFTGGLLFGQKPPGPSLEINGYCRGRVLLKDVSVKVYVDGKLLYVQTPTILLGSFLIYIPYNKNFKVLIEKEGYVSYNFEGTTMLKEGMNKVDDSMPMDIKMIKLPDDSSKVVFTEPIAKIVYDEEVGGFDRDLEYDAVVAEKLIALEKTVKEKDKVFAVGKPPVTKPAEPVAVVDTKKIETNKNLY